MRVEAEIEKIWQNKGIIAMRTATGIRALYQGLASGKDQVMVMEGNLVRLRQSIGLDPIEFEKLDDLLINNEVIQYDVVL